MKNKATFVLIERSPKDLLSLSFDTIYKEPAWKEGDPDCAGFLRLDQREQLRGGLNGMVEPGDIATTSAAQRKEARYHGGRFSKEYLSRPKDAVIVWGLVETDSSSQAKWGRRRHKVCPSLIKLDLNQ